MKYIKTYEKLLKKTDDRVVNHPLKKLIEKFIQLLNNLAECDNFNKFKITTFYTENSVKISYKEIEKHSGGFGKIEFELFLIQIHTYHNGSYSVTQNMKSVFRYKYIEHRKIVYDKLHELFNKYISEENYLYAGGRNEFYINNVNDIIIDINKIIKDLEIYINKNKYNL